jgi:hypothetical protein
LLQSFRMGVHVVDSLMKVSEISFLAFTESTM